MEKTVGTVGTTVLALINDHKLNNGIVLAIGYCPKRRDLAMQRVACIDATCNGAAAFPIGFPVNSRAIRSGPSTIEPKVLFLMIY